MSLDAIKALPIGELAATSAHLYLWIPSALMEDGFPIIRAWGFNFKTVFTWVKHQVGLGSYLRNSTEHALFAVRGRLPVLRRDIRNWVMADRRQHSRKPDEFYRIVEDLSPGPRIDVFSREKRPGWDQWGDQSDFFNKEEGDKNGKPIAETAGSGGIVGSFDSHALRVDERRDDPLPQGRATATV